MNFRPFFLHSLASVLVTGMAFGQEVKDIPPPSPPFVAPVAEKMDWTVTAKHPPKAPPPPDTPQRPDWRIAEVHSTKTGAMKRDVVKSMDGTSKEIWFVDTFLLWPNLQGEISVSDASGADGNRAVDDDNPSVPVGFPGVGWVNLGNFQDVALYEKQPCYHYLFGSMEAWIHVKTRLPVAYKSAGTLYQFTFHDAPSSPLTLPADYQKAWDLTQKIMNNRKKVWKDLGNR